MSGLVVEARMLECSSDISSMRTLPLAFTVCFIMALPMSSCTPAPPITPEESARLSEQMETLFRGIQHAIQRGDALFIFNSLSPDSKSWINNIRYAAQSEPYDYLDQRPFFELLSILALRQQERINQEFKFDPVSIISQLIINVPPVKKNFLKFPLADFRLNGSRGQVGLKKAPNTPVFFFTRVQNGWTLDLAKSLPIILLGAESLSRQKAKTPILQAVYILENFSGHKVLEEDLIR